ncbi:MAG: AAA family ATPase [Desulfomonilaceae bacterium]
MTGRLDDLIPALSDPSIYPHRPDSVQVVQTHISVVFIGGELVYKIKKPVNLGFLDFTTLEKRTYFCQQEVRLNSRFSEGIYLGVAAIHEGPSGINLKGEGDEIEAAVLMHRIPPDRLLIGMLHDHRVTPELLDRLADRLAYFHSHAARGPQITSFGSPQVIYQNLKENFEQTIPYVGRTIDAQTHEAVSTLAFEFLEKHQSLFRERMESGFIRDCHGDLHLEHVVILDEIMLYDCIEFNDRFRYGDTAADLAFLLMDLDFRGYPAFADRIAGRYADWSDDREILKLLGFYKSYRAFVRGKVEGFFLDEPEVSEPERESAREVAKKYFALSLVYLKPPPSPLLVITTGLMGTGKSHLASGLGQRLGIRPVRSDVLRKEIQGLSPLERRFEPYGKGIYSEEATEQTYADLLERAAKGLLKGESVIVDASFSQFHHRDRARELAHKTGARFGLVECTAPHAEIRRRMEERATKEDEPSDGRWEIFKEQEAHFEPVRKNEASLARAWDSTTDMDSFLTSFVWELMFASH